MVVPSWLCPNGATTLEDEVWGVLNESLMEVWHVAYHWKAMNATKLEWQTLRGSKLGAKSYGQEKGRGESMTPLSMNLNLWRVITLWELI